MTKRILYIMLVAQLFVGVLQAQKPVQNRRQAAGQSMERQGLVNVKAVVPSIKVALMYARTDNFCHRMLYHDLRDAYVLQHVLMLCARHRLS